MFGIGTAELLIIAIVALLLFPPHELPKMMRSVAKAWGTVRRTADEFRDAVMQEESMKEVRDAYKGAQADLRKAEVDARRELMKARVEARKAEAKLMQVSKEREKKTQEAEQAKLAEGEGATDADPNDEGAAVGDAADAGADGDAAPNPAGTVPSPDPRVRAPEPANEPDLEPPPLPQNPRDSEAAKTTRERIAEAQAVRDRLAAQHRAEAAKNKAAAMAAKKVPPPPPPPPTTGKTPDGNDSGAKSQGAA